MDIFVAQTLHGRCEGLALCPPKCFGHRQPHECCVHLATNLVIGTNFHGLRSSNMLRHERIRALTT